MKFTRTFILRALNADRAQIIQNNEISNPLLIFKEVVISHPYIDIMICLILSFLVTITNFNSDPNFIYMNSLNFYFINFSLLMTILYYLFIEYIDGMECTSQTWSLSNNNSQDLFANNFKFNVEVLLKYCQFPHLTKPPLIFFNNWLTFKSILNLLKIFLSFATFFLSLIFCILYGYQKNRIDKDKYFFLHTAILDFYEFYNGFRICYFLVKILINIFCLPIYISSLILGMVEDKQNRQMNDLINTKFYLGRQSMKQVENGRVSELEEYCSICLNSFKFDELVSTLPCSRRHTFHTVCLEKWFTNTISCPLCRSDFNNSTELREGLRQPLL
jgi:hypothetical protein